MTEDELEQKWKAYAAEIGEERVDELMGLAKTVLLDMALTVSSDDIVAAVERYGFAASEEDVELLVDVVTSSAMQDFLAESL